ncbi:unnamed protein product [Alopecurus aequalis]
MGGFFLDASDDTTAVRVVLCILGAVAALLLGLSLYHAYTSWATRRREAAARGSAVKKIKMAIFRDLDSEHAPDGDAECAVCLEDYDDEIARLGCGHLFHYRCVRRWIAEGRPACPLCSAPV